MPVTMPKTKQYRVAVLAVTYLKPTEGFDGQGQAAVVNVSSVARFGEEIGLTDGEAKRLESLGSLVNSNDPTGERRPAVKPVDEPLSYEEMTVEDLATEAESKGIEVRGSGANGGVLKDDLVNALREYDRAAGTAAE